jgi:fermentation-respiration switch protein FrsA (DUF1100 family)
MSSLRTILAESQVPEICIIHGQADEIIPLKMGRTLAQSDPNRIKFVEVPEARHNDIVEMALPLILERLTPSDTSPGISQPGERMGRAVAMNATIRTV